MADWTSSDLSAASIQGEALAYLRKESLDIYNRIHSIDEDVAFVNQVRAFYPEQALLPNLRCGAWYTDPQLARKDPAYFKSTDGHYHGWSFNLRRPNLHLLSVAIEHSGIILVDSTRSGKRLPDALSKTVPIWCAVINRAICLRHEDPLNESPWDTALYTPPGAVSAQEHQQIEAKLDDWARDLSNSSYTLPNLPHPLRPFWITPMTTSFPSTASSPGQPFIPIICVSASRQVHEGVERRSLGFAYVQGSGDDHELWGMGLDPKLFWEHKGELLQAERHDLPALVGRLVALRRPHQADGSNGWRTPPTPIAKASGRIQLCSLSDLPNPLPGESSTSDASPSQTFILLHPTDDALPTAEPSPAYGLPQRILHLRLAPGKRGQHDFLHKVLPQAVSFASSALSGSASAVVVACEAGKDASVGVALVLLQLFVDDAGVVHSRPIAGTSTKQSIRTRLEWIIASRPEANPSRTTLKRVNEYLLSSAFEPAPS
ncbi:initiator tRNA phosphoribosyl transferase [Amylostereum chailletii]|nr:initiator tRNA phosphoribosyl transferase [Amylostereum chailletii]